MSGFVHDPFSPTHSALDSEHSACRLAVAGFRRLNRARVQLFKGDDHAMKESRIQLRAQLEANRSAPTSGPVFEELVNGMDEAASMLTHEIVRGDLNQDTGRYGRSISSVCVRVRVLFCFRKPLSSSRSPRSRFCSFM